MADILFYEKPGCQNNAKQKALLQDAGHTVIAQDILSTAWTAAMLRPFFGELDVALWFNRASPRIKSGEIVPENLTPESALNVLLADHLLIRRPLMRIEQQFVCGFSIPDFNVNITTSPGDCAMNKHVHTCSRTLPCPSGDEGREHDSGVDAVSGFIA
ncbi:MAG: thioredoxin domain-containing protein [Halothiobacillus sp.]